MRHQGRSAAGIAGGTEEQTVTGIAQVAEFAFSFIGIAAVLLVFGGLVLSRLSFPSR